MDKDDADQRSTGPKIRSLSITPILSPSLRPPDADPKPPKPIKPPQKTDRAFFTRAGTQSGPTRSSVVIEPVHRRLRDNRRWKLRTRS